MSKACLLEFRVDRAVSGSIVEIEKRKESRSRKERLLSHVSEELSVGADAEGRYLI